MNSKVQVKFVNEIYPVCRTELYWKLASYSLEKK